jgi:hypothetical protein
MKPLKQDYESSTPTMGYMDMATATGEMRSVLLALFLCYSQRALFFGAGLRYGTTTLICLPPLLAVTSLPPYVYMHLLCVTSVEPVMLHLTIPHGLRGGEWFGLVHEL